MTSKKPLSKARKKTQTKQIKKPFDKYFYYESSVQCVENDIDFIVDQFKALRGKSPKVIREDFGGTGKLCCEWVKQGEDFRAVAVDLDSEPINYGKEHHHSQLSSSQKKRVSYEKLNVLDATDIKADVIVAFNFSYCIFKSRQELLHYFKTVKASLKKGGLFFIDLFGGENAQELIEEETEHDGYSYFWDCDRFDPISNHCLFKIHFKRKGEKKREDVFVYDWRLWSLPELRDIMKDAGFGQTRAYWEGDGDDGTGDGDFYITESEENCESWVTYLAAFD